MSSKYEIHLIDAKRSWRWRPEELAGFLPHSLEWLVELSSALRARGHGVTVYYDGVDTEYNNVHYRNRREYDGRGTVQIYWSDPNAFIPKSESDLTIYWSNCYELYGDKVPSFKDIDLIVTKSQVHFEGVSEVIQKLSKTPEDVDKVISIMPGLNRDQFGPVVPKEDNHFLYASPWDQGLDRVLKIWPKIRKAIPDAKLSVCYGGGFSARMLGKKKLDVEKKYALGLRQHGISNLGCVDRIGMGKLFRQAGLYLGASDSEETFGGSAYKAQFAGCIPIVTDHTALSETVRDGGVSVSWKDYLEAVLKVARSQDAREIIRSKQSKIVFPTWDEVAAAWEEEMRIRIEASNGNQDEEAHFS